MEDFQCGSIRKWDGSDDIEDRLRLAREISRTLQSCEHTKGRHFIQRAWDAAIPPRRALKIIEAWCTQATAGAEFCSRYFPKAEVLVIGHFHRQGCWRRGNRLVINTGSFMNPGRARWVQWQDGWLTCGDIDETPDSCQMGETLAVWRCDD